MNNGQITTKFFSVIDSASKAAILSNVAGHYGITSNEAMEEITHDEAEPILEYVTGPQRAATSVLMKRHGLSA